MNKKILYITTSYEQKNSSAAVRNNALVNGLISNGYDVTVLTVNWPESMKSTFFIQNNRAKIVRIELPELKAVGLMASKNGHSNNIISRIRHFIRDLIYFPDMCKRMANKVNKFNTKEFDYLISSSDLKSSHFVAWKIKNKHPDIKWLQVWGDPWGSDITLSSIHKIRIRNAENNILKAADTIVYVSSLTYDYMRKKFPDLQQKIHYIPRSFYTKVKKMPRINKDILTIIYPGVLFYGRNIAPLLEAIGQFNKESPTKFELHLFGNYPMDKVNTLNRYDFVIIHPSVEYDEILNTLSVADICLFLSNDSDSTQIPGKLFDFFGTELPILCILNNGAISLYNILSQFDRCKIAYNSKQEILNCLKEIAESKGKTYPFELAYSPKNIGKQIIDLLLT